MKEKIRYLTFSCDEAETPTRQRFNKSPSRFSFCVRIVVSHVDQIPEGSQKELITRMQEARENVQSSDSRFL